MGGLQMLAINLRLPKFPERTVPKIRRSHHAVSSLTSWLKTPKPRKLIKYAPGRKEVPDGTWRNQNILCKFIAIIFLCIKLTRVIRRAHSAADDAPEGEEIREGFDPSKVPPAPTPPEIAIEDPPDDGDVDNAGSFRRPDYGDSTDESRVWDSPGRHL